MERRVDDDFRTFWTHYPRRIGKLAAQKAYKKALTMATPAQILEGVERYKQHKPDYADWCMPTTFLNQGRWLDEYDEPGTVAPTCPHVPPCDAPGRWQCQQKTKLEQAKRSGAA